MRKIDTLALALTILVLCGCGNWLSVQPQGEVIPKTDEEFAAIIHNRLRNIEGGEDEFVIGNIVGLKNNNVMGSASLPVYD